MEMQNVYKVEFEALRQSEHKGNHKKTKPEWQERLEPQDIK